MGLGNLDMKKNKSKFIVQMVRILGIFVALCVIGGIFYGFLWHKNQNLTRFSADINQPVAAHLSDENLVILSDDIPNINNNRNSNINNNRNSNVNRNTNENRNRQTNVQRNSNTNRSNSGGSWRNGGRR